MNSAQQNYAIREQECLAIFELVTKYEWLLAGSCFQILCYSDHKSLEQLNSGAMITNKRLARWKEKFDEFDYKIVWIARDTNLIGDGVSRSLRSPEGLKYLPNSHGERERMPKVYGVRVLSTMHALISCIITRVKTLHRYYMHCSERIKLI